MATCPICCDAWQERGGVYQCPHEGHVLCRRCLLELPWRDFEEDVVSCPFCRGLAPRWSYLRNRYAEELLGIGSPKEPCPLCLRPCEDPRAHLVAEHGARDTLSVGIAPEDLSLRRTVVWNLKCPVLVGAAASLVVRRLSVERGVLALSVDLVAPEPTPLHARLAGGALGAWWALLSPGPQKVTTVLPGCGTLVLSLRETA